MDTSRSRIAPASQKGVFSAASMKPILVCFAVPEEAKYFSAPSDCAAQVDSIVTGIGAANAERGLRAQLDRRLPGLVLTCGFAGGLQPGLSIGSIVFNEDTDARVGEVLAPLLAHKVVFHCSPRIVVTAAEKRALATRTGAAAVEMESGVIREICRNRGIPSATVRVISDTVEEDLPLDFNALATAEMELSYLKLAWALLRSPGRIGGLLRLQRHTQSAARVLAQVLQELVRSRAPLLG
jgi:adenosylhomocysteine nucleosidase